MPAGANAVVIRCTVTAGSNFAHDLGLELENRFVYHLHVLHHSDNITDRRDVRLRRESALVGQKIACMMFTGDSGSRDGFVNSCYIVEPDMPQSVAS